MVQKEECTTCAGMGVGLQPLSGGSMVSSSPLEHGLHAQHPPHGPITEAGFQKERPEKYQFENCEQT